ISARNRFAIAVRRRSLHRTRAILETDRLCFAKPACASSLVQMQHVAYRREPDRGKTTEGERPRPEAAVHCATIVQRVPERRTVHRQNHPRTASRKKPDGECLALFVSESPSGQE